jgi:hypothetical protein
MTRMTIAWRFQQARVVPVLRCEVMRHPVNEGAVTAG